MENSQTSMAGPVVPPKLVLGPRRARVLTHSANVRRLRVLLPVICGVLIAASVAAVVIARSTGVSIQFDKIGLQNGRVIMANPQVEGANDEGETFSISAEKASQDPLAPKIVDMNDVLASLPMGDGTFGILTALMGRYDANTQKVRLDEDILFELEDGSSVSLGEADIDLTAGTLDSAKPIRVEYQGGSLDAGTIAVSNHGKIISLAGGVSLVIPPELLSQANSGGVTDEEVSDQPAVSGNNSDG
jgi:lipopolysaccharide export system protein LptC